ncbi:MAG: trypsin-like peptidase domain-containing protein, partial [Planctomycetales bacterium]|nr:trypsin-like peptidase domain-containing protein [Planctomycetales bacterium]
MNTLKDDMSQHLEPKHGSIWRRWQRTFLIGVAVLMASAMLVLSFAPALTIAQEQGGSVQQGEPRVSLKPLPRSSKSSSSLARDGNTYVSLASGLERVFRGSEPATLAELKLLEIQQTKVAAAIEDVTVNVQQGTAQGSGVIITADGYVLTAAHVAGKPNLLATIVFSDGRKVAAKTLGMNRNTDAGLLKIIDTPQEGWPFATLGRVQSQANPDASLREGQWCIAAGFPGGFKHDRGAAIRVGRILKIQRGRSGKAHTLFTDCALIGGDSGGPLFTLDGTLIGIHSRIGTEISENMHVPVDVFADNWQEMVAGKAWGVLPGLESDSGPELPEPRPEIGVSGDLQEQRPVIAAVTPG